MSDYPVGLQKRPFPYHVDTTADHWWPKGIQRLWADPDGYISRVKPSSGVEKRKPPKRGSKKGFAHKRGGHRVVFGVSPWNHTFEPDFDEIDNKAPPVLGGMARQLGEDCKGLYNPTSTGHTTDTLVKLCFSLLIRSPAFRDRFSNAGASFGLRFNEETGKANLSHFWNAAKEIDLTKCNSCNLLLLYSNEEEYCFGDGLYDTIFTRPVSWRPLGEHWVADLVGDAFVPLLPSVCAYLHFMRGGCGGNTKMIQVASDVVSEINVHTQIFSKEQLFFRSSPPALTEEYKRGEHMMISSGHKPLISSLRAQLG